MLRFFAVIGFAVVCMAALGAVGIGDFRLFYGPSNSINCTREPAP